MNRRFLRTLLILVLALSTLLSAAACTDGSAPEETTAAFPSDTSSGEPAETVTQAPTEGVTEAPLPTEITLPDGYDSADIVYECDDDSTVHTFKDKTADDFASACTFYAERGFELYASTEKNGSRFTTFVGDGPMAHIYWLKNSGELNIVISATAAATLPPAIPEVTDGDYTCTVTQLKDNANVNGMAYIIQLKDGSYIIYDGSYTSQARKIQKFLTDNYQGEGKPTVRAWILTHSHNDHYPSFRTFCSKMSNSATVEHVIISPLNEDNFTMNEEEIYLSTDVHEDIAKLDGAKTVYAHTGMEFTFCNLKLEILMTPDDLYKADNHGGNFNNTSIVSRLYDESYSALFLADIGVEGSTLCEEIFGDYLQSDICQASHQGVENGPLSFYETVKASILYYPCNLWLYDQTERHWDVRRALEERDYTKEILIAGLGTYTRAWGTTFAADAPLSMPDYPSK